MGLPSQRGQVIIECTLIIIMIIFIVLQTHRIFNQAKNIKKENSFENQQSILIKNNL